MGTRNRDRMHFSDWAQNVPDVGRMRRDGWRVRAACMNCGLQMTVELEHVIRLRGPGFSFWGKRSPCRDLRCQHGVMIFHGLPPGGQLWGELTKTWITRLQTQKAPPAEADGAPGDAQR